MTEALFAFQKSCIGRILVYDYPRIAPMTCQCRLLLAVFMLLSWSAPAQIGRWHSFTNMKEVRDVAVSGDRVWAATSGGVFSFDDKSGVFESFTNVDGLSSIDITAVTSDPTGRIIVGASNGAVHIYTRDRGWTGVLDIVNASDKPMKGINVIRVRGSLLYIGTDFGIATYDPGRGEFRDNYLKFGALASGIPVNDIFFRNDSIWVATSQGIAVADLRGSNLQDPANWLSYTKANGLPTDDVISLAEISGGMAAGTPHGVSLFTDGMWTSAINSLGDKEIRRLASTGNVTYAVTPTQVFAVISAADVRQLGDAIDDAKYPPKTQWTGIALKSDGTLVLGSISGIAEYVPGQMWELRKPNGPVSNQFSSMCVDTRGALWVATGTSGQGITYYSSTNNGPYMWREYTQSSSPSIPTNDVGSTTSVPDGSVLFTTWGKGVLRYRGGDQFDMYNKVSVPNFPVYGGEFAPVTDAAVDPFGNIWTLHDEPSEGSILGTLSTNGGWTFYKAKPDIGAAIFTSLAIDQYGQKWIGVTRPFIGILVFSDNGTATTDDDTWQRLDSSDPVTLNTEGNAVQCLAVDRLGDVWIGSAVGLRTVFDPRSPKNVRRTCFNTLCNIEGQSINCIEIDPVNNKWLGTQNGVFVLSPDGSTILNQYTTENSLLIDNDVRSIVVHPETGVAYIGTFKGLSALETPYSRPKAVFDRFRISPNPFKPGIDDAVMIDGLIESASLKIVSVSGDVVADIPTPGGRVGFWDGRTVSGKYAASGVYLVVAYSVDGSQANVGKLAVIEH